MQHFPAAPWPTSLKVTSLIATALLVVVGYAVFTAIPVGTRVPFAETFGQLIAIVPPAIGLLAALFIVSGYELDGGILRVRRLLWSTTVPLAGIRKATHEPGALKGSLRVFGNGGLYSVTGIYQNPTLGRYRAFVTDPARAVVLALPGRVVVVSPSDPNAFVQALHRAFPAIGDDA